MTTSSGVSAGLSSFGAVTVSLLRATNALVVPSFSTGSLYAGQATLGGLNVKGLNATSGRELAEHWDFWLPPA